MKREMNLRCGILDFQVGECHDAIPFDGGEYVKASAAAGVQSVVFTCKDAYGAAYYDSELVARNAAVQSDCLAAAVAAGKTHNVDIYAYYNILLDDKIAGLHPEYRMVNGGGQPVIAYDYYKILCPNSPYREIVLERVADLVRRYDVQGVFMDITYFQPGTCHCRYCRERFERQFGYPLPSDMERGSRELRDFYAFRRQSRYELLESLTRTIRGIRDVDILWNGSGSYALGENEIDEQSDCLTSEFHAPDFTDGLIRAKWMQSRNKPYIMSTPYELGSWGDWSLLPRECMQAVFSLIAANGGGLFVNHVPYPSGEFASSVNDSVLDCIDRVYGRIQELEPWLKGARSVPDVAVICSIEARRLSEWAGGELSGYNIQQALTGVARMLLEGGRHFDILTEEDFRRRAGEYRTVVLAGVPCLEEQTVAAVREFVRAGGSALAAGPVTLYGSDGVRLDNFALSDVFGADFAEFSPYTVDYIHDIGEGMGEGVPGNPILVHKSGMKALRVTAGSAAAVRASLVEPLFEATLSRHVYHQHAHPARRSGYPAAIMNRLGRGMCVYFAPEIFASYANTGSPWLRELFLNSLGGLNQGAVRLEGPCCIHVSLMELDGRRVVHLINVSGARFDPSKSFMTRMIPVHDIRVRLDWPARKVYAAPGGQPLPFTVENGETVVAVPEVGVHSVLVVE